MCGGALLHAVQHSTGQRERWVLHRAGWGWGGGGSTALGRGVQRCTELREGLLQRTEPRCRILRAVEMLSAAQDQGRGSAGSEMPVLHRAGGIAWDEDAQCHTELAEVAGLEEPSAGAHCPERMLGAAQYRAPGRGGDGDGSRRRPAHLQAGCLGAVPLLQLLQLPLQRLMGAAQAFHLRQAGLELAAALAGLPAAGADGLLAAGRPLVEAGAAGAVPVLGRLQVTGRQRLVLGPDRKSVV